jgi:hypothetical protein
MSTKTLRKRIALVAVAALGAGVLSVAPANAALSDVDRDTVGYTATGSVGICKAPVNNASDTLQASGEVLVGGTVAFTLDATNQLEATGDQLTISVAGPAAISSYTASASTPAATTYGAGLKSLAIVGTVTSNGNIGTGFSLSATGAGTIQVTVSKNALGASAAVLEYYYILASAACATNTLSAANSFVRVTFAGAPSSSTLPTSNTTAATAATTVALANSADRIANGGYGLIAVRVMDGTAVPAILTVAGIFGASATNGAVVDWNASSALESSSAYESVAGHNTLSVWQGTANKDKPMSTVVTVTYNGVVLGSRTINFTGKATKLTIDTANAGTGSAGEANIYAAGYEITDAAGNKLTSEGPGITGASEDNAGLIATSGTVVDSAGQSIVTAAASSISIESSGYIGAFGWTCGTGSGSAKIYLKYTFSDLTSLVSNTHDAACGYTAVNYKASLDKASYAPGEIAKLTITATDKNGKAVYDTTAAGAGVAMGTFADNIAVILPQLTPVTSPTYSDVFVGSKKTYLFTVGTTEGSFAGVVDLPYYESTTYAQAAQTVSYKVAYSSTVISLADVLKAIVSLIASINKQIAALQKALLKK